MSKRILTTVICFLMIAACNLAGCEKEAVLSDFTVSVISEGGLPLEGVRITVYADEQKNDLVWAADSDSDGATAFKADAENEYFLFLENLPKGYSAEEYYTVTDTNTEISVKTALLSTKDLSNKAIGLSDIFFDFTVTDVNGKEYTLSELLKTKKAVVLNFWYLNCAPCKMEFPFLNEAYTECSDSVEVIAINPVDGDNEAILAFAKENGLTFPMAKGGEEWIRALDLSAYPTTLVIDRYGAVGMIHKGYITEKETFTSIFNYFTSDDYVQSTVRNIEDIK